MPGSIASDKVPYCDPNAVRPPVIQAMRCAANQQLGSTSVRPCSPRPERCPPPPAQGVCQRRHACTRSDRHLSSYACRCAGAALVWLWSWRHRNSNNANRQPKGLRSVVDECMTCLQRRPAAGDSQLAVIVDLQLLLAPRGGVRNVQLHIQKHPHVSKAMKPTPQRPLSSRQCHPNTAPALTFMLGNPCGCYQSAADACSDGVRCQKRATQAGGPAS